MTQSQQECIVLLDGYYSQRNKFLFFPKSTVWEGQWTKMGNGQKASRGGAFRQV